jgi:hypothetical protein
MRQLHRAAAAAEALASFGPENLRAYWTCVYQDAQGLLTEINFGNGGAK